MQEIYRSDIGRPGQSLGPLVGGRGGTGSEGRVDAAGGIACCDSVGYRRLESGVISKFLLQEPGFCGPPVEDGFGRDIVGDSGEVDGHTFTLVLQRENGIGTELRGFQRNGSFEAGFTDGRA